MILFLPVPWSPDHTVVTERRGIRTTCTARVHFTGQGHTATPRPGNTTSCSLCQQVVGVAFCGRPGGGARGAASKGGFLSGGSLLRHPLPDSLNEYKVRKRNYTFITYFLMSLRAQSLEERRNQTNQITFFIYVHVYIRICFSFFAFFTASCKSSMTGITHIQSYNMHDISTQTKLRWNINFIRELYISPS